MLDSTVQKASVLVEAIPYIQKYRDAFFVVKLGGSLLRTADIINEVLTDIAFLHLVGIRCVVVSGGGPFINEELQKRGKKPRFVDGLRVTDQETLAVVREVTLRVRDRIVSYFTDELKVNATAVDPEEGCLVAQKMHYQKGAEVIDLGSVGLVAEVKADVLAERVVRSGVAVMTPVGCSREGELLNINGDTVSCAVATALAARKLIFVTNVPGIMRNTENPDTLISTLSVSQAEGLMREGTIKDGMVPKVKAAISAVSAGVEKVHIVGGAQPHALLLEIFTNQGVGTEIMP